ncbi:MAG: hypothetical protein QOG20_4426 [Pseudonocardiales bacterium]|nr:hypothetical protein [Pseudonocardiales bacterium]
MPLDPLQGLIVRTASTLPEAHTIALAGGGAMIAHGFVDRATQDVDLFTEIDDTEARHVREMAIGALLTCGQPCSSTIGEPSPIRR